MTNSKAVIDIIAPNARTFNMLEFVVQQHGKGRFELGKGARPELVVVDFEKADTWTAFRKYRAKFPQIPAVLLLNQPEEYQALPESDRIGSEYILLKPFAVKDFIAKIDECLSGSLVRQQATLAQGGKSVSSGGATGVTHAGLDATASRRKGAPEQTLPLRPGSRPAQRQRDWGTLENDEIGYSFALESDIDLADEAAVERIWLDTDSKLLGYLKSAVSQQISANTPLCLSVGDAPRIYISPFAKKISIAGGDAVLFDLAERDIEGGQVSLRQEAMPENSRNQIELEAFLWKLALHTYRGRLPSGLGVNQPVYLKYWPNLTRFEPTPNAMRIAALLCRQPVSLAFVARILGLPQAHVFNFYAAANAAGFAGPAVREVDLMLQPVYPDELAISAGQGDVVAAAVSDRKVM
jgi:hypothetical protein